MQYDQTRRQQLASSARESTRIRSATSSQDGVVFDSELSVRDYYNSNFPSLLTQLGTCNDRQVKAKHKKKEIRRPSIDGHRLHRNKAPMTFAEEMRRRNEAQWMRIQAVAKEKLDKYDEYARCMLVKVRKQREQINRRSEELLDSLARQEERKREERFNDSSHSRIWRHHRIMQRRAFSLEPMSRTSLEPINSRDGNTFSVKTPRTKVST